MSNRNILRDTFLEKGLGFVTSKSLCQAEEAFKACVEIDPSCAEGHYKLGFVRSKLGRLKESEEAYREAIRCDPDYAEAHHNLGALLSKSGRDQEAEDPFRQAIRCRPELAEAHFGLGYVLNELRLQEQAEEEYRKAIHCDPNYTMAHIRLGNLLCDLDRYTEAEEIFRRAIRSSSANAWERATAYFFLQRIVQARRLRCCRGRLSSIDLVRSRLCSCLRDVRSFARPNEETCSRS